MVELADTQDLGSCASPRVGSSPTIRTITGSGSTECSQTLFLFQEEKRGQDKDHAGPDKGSGE